MRGVQPSEREVRQSFPAVSVSLAVSLALSSLSLSLALSLWDDLGMVVCEDEGGQRGV
jgi:hypothetical protein